jgi:superfamily II DNA/RNA helicase
MSDISVADLNLPRPLLAALDRVGYETPSPIQAEAIPILLTGRDLLGHAPTGTGKTAAFALPPLSGPRRPSPLGVRRGPRSRRYKHPPVRTHPERGPASVIGAHHRHLRQRLPLQYRNGPSGTTGIPGDL